jgi:predicted SAM-dependent methyltransferase
MFKIKQKILVVRDALNLAARRQFLSYRRIVAKRKLLQFSHPYRLNIGCGKIRFDGWVNIDIVGNSDVVDIYWNAVDKFDFLDAESCYFIYCEHFLEHLTVEQGIQFLSECYRMLQPGGILRIAMPSLEYIVEKYCSENWQKQDWLTWPEYQFIKTRAEMINIAFRWWGHQWLYDREELHRRLNEVGFTKLTDVEWGNSKVPGLSNRETRLDSILICEAQK